ncbi:MAG TPA: hypothetical protein VGN02_06640 [Paenibacillus sp.]|jgi:hypothetical protein
MQPCPLKIQMFEVTLLSVCGVRYDNDKNKLYRSSFGDQGKLLFPDAPVVVAATCHGVPTTVVVATCATLISFTKKQGYPVSS